jgi:hypothetical protein
MTTTQIPRIEIWSRDVENTPVIPFFNTKPQHLYMLKINIDGTREIARGGTANNNMISDDFKMVSQSYNGPRQNQNGIQTYDFWDGNINNNPLHHQLLHTYQFGSQELLNKSFDQGFVFDNWVNSQNFDYEPMSQNSNTGNIKRIEAMGLNPNPIYNSLKNKNLIAPAAKKDFSHSIIDKFYDDSNTVIDWGKDQFEKFFNTLKKQGDIEESYNIFEGDKSIQLANSNLIASDAIYVDENNNPTSLYDSLFVGKDSQMNSFTILKNNVYKTLQDNSKATLSSILNTLDSSIAITANFLTFQAQKTAEIILTRIKSDKYIDSLIGSVLADIILGENDPKQISKNLVKGQLNSLATSLLDENIRKILIDSGMTTTQINNLVGPKAVNYVITYDNSGSKIITAFDANGNLVGPTLNGTIYTAILNFAISAADSSGWSSEEYGTASANQNSSYHPKLNFNDNQKYQKKLVANDNYENIFMLLIDKNA